MSANAATKRAAEKAAHTITSPRGTTRRFDGRHQIIDEKRLAQFQTLLAAGAKLWTPKRSNGLRFIDIFCGAGGSSIGLSNAGYELLLGANHWQTAIDTHGANFPGAEHLCADVNNYDMRCLPQGADVLWASPICTEASPAGGNTGYKRKDPAPGKVDMLRQMGHVSSAGMTRTRATFGDVIRAVELWRFKAVIVENVPDVVDRWELFDWWLEGMQRLGYHYTLVSVNSAHIGGEGIAHAPQWRDRLYIVFIRKDIGRTPDLDPRPLARCFNCERDVNGVQTWAPAVARKQFKVGRYRRDPNTSYGQYWYTCPEARCRQRVEPYIVPAASIIDWSDVGVRIGDLPRTKAKPEGLAPKTMQRIRAGLARYGNQAIYASVAGNTFERPGYVRAWPVDGQPLGTAQATGTQALAVPPGAFYVKNYTHQDNPDRMVKGISGDAFGTMTASNSHSVVVPGGAFTVNSNHDDDRIRPVDRMPLAARTTKIGEGLVVPPMSVPVGGTWAEDPVNLLDSPARTVMANEKGCEALVTSQPFIAMLRNNGGAVPVSGPVPTITAGGTHHALIVPYYSTRSKATTTGGPLGTVTSHDSFAMVGAGQLAQMAEMEAMEAFYRMLKARESLRAQTFPDDYIVLGGSGEQTMQAGNAVSCNVAEWIGRQVAAVLTPHAAL